MRSTIKVARMLSGQLAACLHKPIFLLGLLLGMTFALAPTMSMLRASVEGSMQIHIFEAFILIACNSFSCLPMMLGLILMLSDAPFIHEDIAHIALRATRIQWMVTQFLYIAFICIIYFGIILLFTMSICASNGFSGNLWSPTLLRISKDMGFANKFNLAFSNELFLRQYAPYQALRVCFILQTVYGFILSMIMFTFNMLFRRGSGIVIALALHQLGYIMLRDGHMFANQYLSLMVHALPTTHSYSKAVDHLPTLAQSFVVFGCFSLMLIGVCLAKAQSVDFLVSADDG